MHTTDLASEELISAAEGLPGGTVDQVPLLAKVKEINGTSDAAGRAAELCNSHPLVQGWSEELVGSVTMGEDKAPLLVKGRLASDDLEQEVISSSNGGVSIQGHHQPKGRNGTLPEIISLEEMEVKYAAYVRKDAYGTWGAGQWTPWEVVKLILAAVLLVPIRVALILATLVAFYLICRVCTLFRVPSQQASFWVPVYLPVLALEVKLADMFAWDSFSLQTWWN